MDSVNLFPTRFIMQEFNTSWDRSGRFALGHWVKRMQRAWGAAWGAFRAKLRDKKLTFLAPPHAIELQTRTTRTTAADGGSPALLLQRPERIRTEEPRP